jgi:hypothetical protein
VLAETQDKEAVMATTTELEGVQQRQAQLYDALGRIEDQLRMAKDREAELADSVTAATLAGDEKKASRVARELTELRQSFATLEAEELAARRAVSENFHRLRELQEPASKQAVTTIFAQWRAMLTALEGFLTEGDPILRPLAAQLGHDLDRDGSGEPAGWCPTLADTRRWKFFTDRFAESLRANGYDVPAPPTPAPSAQVDWLDKLFGDLGGDVR